MDPNYKAIDAIRILIEIYVLKYKSIISDDDQRIMQYHAEWYYYKSFETKRSLEEHVRATWGFKGG